jgi:hypothetical protein
VYHTVRTTQDVDISAWKNADGSQMTNEEIFVELRVQPDEDRWESVVAGIASGTAKSTYVTTYQIIDDSGMPIESATVGDQDMKVVNPSASYRIYGRTEPHRW